MMTDEDGEEVRLKYRYLDLRRPRMQRNLRLRARLYRAIRRSLDGKGFTELDTPILTKATPEGARDYLVPARVQPGQFYALPQSPQLFKQLFMMSGMDRYYQIARCFRDEDLRADRQPEFTQLDIEMAFVEERDVQDLSEAMMREVFRETLDVELPDPFPRLSWREAMERYGSDKPDLRIPLELVSVDEHVAHLEFKVFAGPANDDGSRVAALRIPGGAELSRKQLDEYANYAGRYGARGLAWIKVNDASSGLGGLQSSIVKFLDDGAWQGIAGATGAASGDLLLFGAGDWLTVSTFMGAVLVKIGHDLELAEAGWKPLWVTEFPMFEWDEDEGRFLAMHHPFTAPAVDDAAALAAEPGKALSKGYDMVLNGADAAGRIFTAGHRRGGSAAEIRFPAGGPPLRLPAARRHRLRPRSHRGADGRRGLDPRRDRLPEDHHGAVSADRRAIPRAGEADSRTSHQEPRRRRRLGPTRESR
jgi:aspartyl-tRNA synthetase